MAPTTLIKINTPIALGKDQCLMISETGLLLGPDSDMFYLDSNLSKKRVKCKNSLSEELHCDQVLIGRSSYLFSQELDLESI